MRALELKIPPPVVALFVAAAMWGISLATPSVEVPAVTRVAAAIAIAMAGLGIAVAGSLAFRRARTSSNPLKPGSTTSLVTFGVYRFTRNPMYLGIVLVLLGWAVFLSSAFALLGPLVFGLYMRHFQIVPEERVLAGIFGTAYAEYQAKVRRWL